MHSWKIQYVLLINLIFDTTFFNACIKDSRSQPQTQQQKVWSNQKINHQTGICFFSSAKDSLASKWPFKEATKLLILYYNIKLQLIPAVQHSPTCICADFFSFSWNIFSDFLLFPVFSVTPLPLPCLYVENMHRMFISVSGKIFWVCEIIFFKLRNEGFTQSAFAVQSCPSLIYSSSPLWCVWLPCKAPFR